MNRKFGIVGIAVLALLLASTGVFAQDNHDRVKVATMPPTSGLYDISLMPPDTNVIVGLPTTGPPPNVATQPTFEKAGPSDLPHATMAEGMSGPGAVLVTPRGAAMSSTKQIADRQIRRIIKRLN